MLCSDASSKILILNLPKLCKSWIWILASCPLIKFFYILARLPEQDWAGTDTPFVKTGMMQEGHRINGEEDGWGVSEIWVQVKYNVRTNKLGPKARQTNKDTFPIKVNKFHVMLNKSYKSQNRKVLIQDQQAQSEESSQEKQIPSQISSQDWRVLSQVLTQDQLNWSQLNHYPQRSHSREIRTKGRL